MASKAHAVLSASSAHRWLFCTPSARLEQDSMEPLYNPVTPPIWRAWPVEQEAVAFTRPLLVQPDMLSAFSTP